MQKAGFPTTVGAVVVALMASSGALARDNYTGNVVGQCVVHQGLTYNVQATVTTPDWYIHELTYVFTPTPSPLTSLADPDDKNRYFLVTPGAYTVNVGNPGPQGTYSITVPDCQPPQKGMTWRLISTNSPTGTIRVGCGNNECDPRHGDTPCTSALPLLCIKKTGVGFPLPPPVTVINTDKYNKWSGGIVGTTSATVPPATLALANALCAQQFDPEWRVAEFHDGWGWYFQAYGGLGQPSERFWVDINDQRSTTSTPKGTCWH